MLRFLHITIVLERTGGSSRKGHQLIALTYFMQDSVLAKSLLQAFSEIDKKGNNVLFRLKQRAMHYDTNKV